MKKNTRERITTERFFQEQSDPLKLKLLAGKKGLKRVVIEPTVNRPGLALAGFIKYIAHKRIQVIGNAEAFYLRSIGDKKREAMFRGLCAYKIPCIVFTRNLPPGKSLIRISNELDVPMFRSPMVTMKFINQATLALDLLFAPRETVLGSMVDIHGVGVLICGESGIGKSESVLALIERGYSLVSDDTTRITLLDGREVIGTSAEITRNHMEVRGIGIIDVASMFGIKSVRSEKRLDLVVTLKSWRDTEEVERVGIDDRHIEILGIPVPHVVIPVRPGRDLARLIEVAAFKTKLGALGYNPAREFNDRLISKMTRED